MFNRASLGDVKMLPDLQWEYILCNIYKIFHVPLHGIHAKACKSHLKHFFKEYLNSLLLCYLKESGLPGDSLINQMCKFDISH